MMMDDIIQFKSKEGTIASLNLVIKYNTTF
jgi:hypothetical protein